MFACYLLTCPVRPGLDDGGLRLHGVHEGLECCWAATMSSPSQKSELLRGDWPPSSAYRARAPVSGDPRKVQNINSALDTHFLKTLYDAPRHLFGHFKIIWS